MQFRMSLLAKIVCSVVATLAVGQLIALIIFVQDFEHNAQKEMFFKARAIGRMAENARVTAGIAMSKHKAFRSEELLADAVDKIKGLAVGSDKFFTILRQTGYYNASIPVVWAFNVARDGADESHFQFKPTRFKARNPDYEPKTAVESDMLKRLEASGDNEIAQIDSEKNVYRYMRKVLLSQECLVCHGGPNDDATRLNTDVDPLGFAKDGKTVGDMHGAFQIIVDLVALQQQVAIVKRNSILAGLSVLVVSCLLIAIFIRKGVVLPVKRMAVDMNRGAEQMNTAAREVSQASSVVADGAIKLAASAEEISSSASVITNITESNTQNAGAAEHMAQENKAIMREVDDKTRENVERARESSKMARKTYDSAVIVQKDMRELAATIGRIESNSDAMVKIIQTIDEIAFQINILALNAAVEAARAGKAGKGFAVVATEVKNLAERVAKAAKEVDQSIGTSQQNARDGVEVTHKAAELFDGINEEIKGLTRLAEEVVQSSTEQAQLIASAVAANEHQAEKVREIAGASAEQSKGVREIHANMESISDTSQQNAAAAEQTSSSVLELETQVVTMKSLVDNLLQIIDGRPPVNRK